MDDKQAIYERINLLQELHRPLEEHWSVKGQLALNAKTSDYNYKHHLSHLEDIYLNRRHLESRPVTQPQMVQSPVTQLYGVNGLQSTLPIQKEKEKRKELRWVGNFQKHHYLSDNDWYTRKSGKKEKSKGQSMGSSKTQLQGEQQDVPQSTEGYSLRTKARSRCRSGKPSQEELILLGMYSLTAEQQEVYDKFVGMLAEFDKFDMRNIIEDAYEDAQTDYVLDDYGGTIEP